MSNSSKDLLALLFIGGMVYGGWRLYKREKENIAKFEAEQRAYKERFDNHVNSELQRINVNHILSMASVQNSNLSVEDRVFVKKLLEGYIPAINNARSIEEFDKSLKKFCDIADEFVTRPDDEIATSLLYYKTEQELANERAIERKKLDAEKRAADLEMRKFNKELEIKQAELELRKSEAVAVAEASSNKININLDNSSSNNADGKAKADSKDDNEKGAEKSEDSETYSLKEFADGIDRVLSYK